MQTLVIWGLAAAVYVAVGVFFTDFMLSVVVAMGYLLLTTWLVPAAIRRRSRLSAKRTSGGGSGEPGGSPDYRRSP